MGKKANPKSLVPECRYGAACTRKDCIYKHPPKKAVAKAKPAAAEAEKVCFSFVAGRCAFGRNCHDKHPDEPSCRTIRERYARIDCQWGRQCKTEGCLYRHPTAQPEGPPLRTEPSRQQPAVYAQGPTIVPVNTFGDESRARACYQESVAIPKALLQSMDLRLPVAFETADPLDRFLAVNAHNSGSKSAALLDMYMQTAATIPHVLDDVLPERLRMFPQSSGGVWVMVGSGGAKGQNRVSEGNLFDVVREYLTKRHYDFNIGHDADGNRCALNVLGRKKIEDPMLGIRAVMLCGLPGSGKTALAEALARKSGGRFKRISQADFNDDMATCEAAWRSELANAAELFARSKAGSWWWDHAFNPETHYLAVCFRTSALQFLVDSFQLVLPKRNFICATLSYHPTALDLRQYLGRPFRCTFRNVLVLECTAAPHVGELFEVILCAVREIPQPGCAARVAMPLHFALTAPKTAARHLQVLNAVPLDKCILANSTLGSFRVRQVIDLYGSPEVPGLCTLMHKHGDLRETPVGSSFDAGALARFRSSGDDSSAVWTEVGQAALNSLDPLVILADRECDNDARWSAIAANHCYAFGVPAPEVQVVRIAPRETKLAQWTKVRSKCLLHCTGEEADVPVFLRESVAVVRPNGVAALPIFPSKDGCGDLRKIIVLDRPNLFRNERKRFLEVGNLAKSEVIAVHFNGQEAAGRFYHSETPIENEGFRAVVPLEGTTATIQALIKKWTAEKYAEGPPRGDRDGAAIAQADLEADDSENEAPPPELPLLAQWIAAEEESQRVMQATSWGNEAVDFDLSLLPGNHEEHFARLGISQDMGSGTAVASSWGESESPSTAPVGLMDRASESAHFESLLRAGMPMLGQPPMQAWEETDNAHHWDSHDRANDAIASSRQVVAPEEDEEEQAREEQLAATLRCMGFDDEPSLLAAQRAGGNLNVAVESMLRSNRAS